MRIGATPCTGPRFARPPAHFFIAKIFATRYTARMAYETSREIAATPEQVFAAISDPERFARWWGPAGFTNTFKVCDFRPGGTWSYTMYGPNGHAYANESVFAEIDPPRKLVIEHVSEPKYRLTITLTPTPAGTRVGWVQDFKNPETGRKLAKIVVPANEQNLDRLTAEVTGAAGVT
jgi:uncharacterized protein YndB with AHSA1/START domain